MTKIIFTNHAKTRASDRRITHSMILSCINSPDYTYEQTEPQGSIKFIKTVNKRRLHVIATKLHQENAWLIISTWVKGEPDPIPFEQQIVLSPFKFFWFLLKSLWKMTVFIWLLNRSKKR